MTLVKLSLDETCHFKVKLTQTVVKFRKEKGKALMKVIPINPVIGMRIHTHLHAGRATLPACKNRCSSILQNDVAVCKKNYIDPGECIKKALQDRKSCLKIRCAGLSG